MSFTKAHQLDLHQDVIPRANIRSTRFKTNTKPRDDICDIISQI